MSKSATCWSRYFSTSRPVGRNWPTTVASTPSELQSASSSGQRSSATARTIRSWASEIQISV